MDPAERSVPEPVRIAPTDGLLLVLTTVPDRDVAASIARTLVDERLAACVNVLGECRSVYRWKGAVEEAGEVTLLVKTTRRRHAACQQRLKALHPYEVPELVTIAPDAVWPAYASWAIAETRDAFGGRDQD
ncbi:MAG: divalent-cation tolerance protein CutA [Burkholderiaceae bacterium]